MIKVAIIGAGPLGRWLALAAARAGYSVLLEDVMPTNLHHAQEYIRQQYSPAAFAMSGAESAGNGSDSANEQPLLPDPCSEPGAPGDRSSSLGWLIPVSFVSTIEEAVRDADLAIDCVPDELESKLEIFWLLDRMAPPRTVLATPTTRLSIADLASCTYRAEKCVAIVLEARDLAARDSATMNHAGESTEEKAAPLLLRTTARTTPETVSLVREFWQRLGFVPTFELDPQPH